MKKTTIILLGACLSVFFVANVFCHRHINNRRKDLLINYTPPNISLSNDFVKIVAGEFKGLMADYLLLEIGSFIGSGQIIYTDDWKKVCRSFEQVLALDPYFQQTYLYVQGNLPGDAKMPKKAIEFLDISRKHRPWDWRPGHYMGFNYYFYLNDYANASEIFLETAKIKDAPVLMALLGGRFALKSQRTEAALILLNSMLEDETLDDKSRKEIEQRIQDLKAGKIDY